LILEPGRVLVGPAGILLSRVLYTKAASEGRQFVIVDAAINDFLRPALYGAVHPVTHAVKPLGREAAVVDVVGPVCETGDCFLSDWRLEAPRAGDLLALWGAGAYGFVAASNYNSRPRPVEVLVAGNRFRIIRRRESRGDLVRGE
jgi:diaminopimelate decarboxylase